MHSETVLDKQSSYIDFQNILSKTCVDVSRRGHHQQAIDAAKAMVTELIVSEYAWKNDAVRACLLEQSLYLKRIGNEREATRIIRLLSKANCQMIRGLQG